MYLKKFVKVLIEIEKNQIVPTAGPNYLGAKFEVVICKLRLVVVN